MKEKVDGIEWEFEIDDGGNAIITRAPKSISGDVRLPAKLKGASVTIIDEHAFDGCRELKSLVMSDNVEKCLAYFENCNALESITISAGMVEPEWRFANCKSLRTINVPKRNLAYKSVNDLLLSKGGETMLLAPLGIVSATIPKGVTKIGPHAFRECTKLKSVKMPDGVITIDRCAFKGCSELESITIPNSVRYIEQGASEGCRKLKTVTIPASVKKVGRFPFWDSSIENAIFMPGVKVIRPIFSVCTLGSVTIPDSVTRINQGAFYDCKGLTSVTIPKKVKVIGDGVEGGAFSDCTDLKSVTLPATLKAKGIGRNAFPKGVKFNWVK